MSKRRKFTAEFKAQAVLEVLTGAKSAAQVCQEHGIKASVLSRWKQELIERAPQAFERGQIQSQHEQQVAELERLVGRLTMELEIAKKASRYLKSTRRGNER